MTKLSVMISTISTSTPTPALHNLLACADHPEIQVAVIFQVSQDDVAYDSWKTFIDLANKKEISIWMQETNGLSKSRNEAILRATSPYIYLSDDDIAIKEDIIVNLVDYAEKNNIDILAFRVSQGKSDYKNYPKKKRSINIINAAQMHSANYILRRDFVLESGVIFPEDMGIGTDLPSGEEYVFLSKLLKKGARGLFVPVVAVEHPDVSSGQSFPRDMRDIRAKRVMFDRVFGSSAWLYRLLFAFKKAPQAFRRVPLREYFRELVLKSTE